MAKTRSLESIWVQTYGRGVRDLEMLQEFHGTLATLVSIIDDPDFDASNPDCVRDLVQYISVQCRAVSGV